MLKRTAVPPILLLLLLAAPLPACRHDFAIEQRETPVHVWLTAPELAQSGQAIDALVYVGSERAVEGPVRFPPGVPHIALPTLYMNGGSNRPVSAVFDGGKISGNEQIGISGETWIQISIEDGQVTIKAFNGPPNCSR